jgi:hypothetical protein
VVLKTEVLSPNSLNECNGDITPSTTSVPRPRVVQKESAESIDSAQGLSILRAQPRLRCFC